MNPNNLKTNNTFRNISLNQNNKNNQRILNGINYSKCDIFWLIVKEGRYASKIQLFKTYLGWIILIILIILIIAFSV